ncbi:hypothetical protein TREMEDRAFT_58286 [Tremella mesenterica DSM 1558]|uniref:uncharacterized protein n=1 Tax=Tremella mesenterica (strain ATCC 24925 / CBS 8224 / DSM 1558 / NBRC 9311 / NRRL Y-6157 / RJB 2259-6 / UBC 559-6) TaxID=578456 RepID=UPI0003F49B39|nr:uncharacterized protein TREMEDRAFT_58286 [Tremella mesenterica DSM 1558]EIW72130.1 hypothetical protein TREMEDRAFT_58286 [Tremella mesenterica DSM 1558]
MWSLLALLATSAVMVRGVITITYPVSDTIWYKNDTVNLNWTTTSSDSDTYFFRALLSNSDQSLLSGNHSIADSTNATADYVRILLPGVSSGSGYIVNFVNTSNEQQVFATSQAFQIQDGTQTSQSSSMISATSTVQRQIPNGQSSSTTPSFPTTSSTTGAAPRTFASIPGLFEVSVTLGLLGAGMALVV